MGSESLSPSDGTGPSAFHGLVPSRSAGRHAARALLHEGIERLVAAGVATARRDAETLLADQLGVDRIGLLVDPPPLGSDDGNRYRATIDRRARGEPVQYILGWEAFCGLRIRVSPDVLIPRPETELLVEWALPVAPPGATVTDVGTGSACIACALAVRRPDVRILAVDASPRTLQVAVDNVGRLRLGARVRVVRGDLLESARPSSIDLIVANLPYIPSAALLTLPIEVREWEPSVALDGGADGMGLHRRLVAQSASVLRPGGMLIMEVGDSQAAGVAASMERAGLGDVSIRRDLNGVDRHVAGRRSTDQRARGPR